MKYISKHSDAYKRELKTSDRYVYDAAETPVTVEYNEAKGELSTEWHLPSTASLNFFVIKGKGTFIINGEAVEAEEKDVVTAGPDAQIKITGVMNYLTIIGPSTDRIKAYDED